MEGSFTNNLEALIREIMISSILRLWLKGQSSNEESSVIEISQHCVAVYPQMKSKLCNVKCYNSITTVLKAKPASMQSGSLFHPSIHFYTC